MTENKRGRPSLGAAHVHKFEASSAAKARLEAILQTLAGEKTIAESCAALGISEAAFHELRDQTMAAALSSLEPKPRGRPRKREPAVSAEEHAALRQQLLDTQMDLYAAQVREELALTMPHVLKKKVSASELPRASRPARADDPRPRRPPATDGTTPSPADPVA